MRLRLVFLACFVSLLVARDLAAEDRVTVRGNYYRETSTRVLAPVVYVESVTRIDGLSLSGRLIKPVASEIFVQWPELAASVAGARYEGGNLAAAA